ncbi:MULTISPECIES: hypothetical protein [unclassified Lysobacter]|uniref:hypothetical protein n=1 Tax=unclassified Lysobacter TaxID=2635362 RepID=UPI001BE97E02|nr:MULTISPECIES: hypothetical protein [unclassified Lysobacter]MBT2749375.1 hypothetical protein [Lysobacter sp. ISL-42]MBT2778423.1 hypothetical protein [Lysobacter sp. ISL-54]MBT2783833.1 hypothetical protein [Lysobacter sp. ISL-52]
MSRESARKPAATRARRSAAEAAPRVSTVRYEIARDSEPEINIVNLSDTEYVLLKAVRELGAGKIDVVVQDSRIVEITRSQRVPVEVAGESWV